MRAKFLERLVCGANNLLPNQGIRALGDALRHAEASLIARLSELSLAESARGFDARCRAAGSRMNHSDVLATCRVAGYAKKGLGAPLARNRKPPTGRDSCRPGSYQPRCDQATASAPAGKSAGEFSSVTARQIASATSPADVTGPVSCSQPANTFWTSPA